MFGNTITVIGNLTRDPELRYTNNGTALGKLGVAWNRKYQQNGKEVEDVSFFNITCWGTLAENISNSSLRQGSRVVVVGRLDQHSYETKDGENRNVVEIVAEEVSPSLKWATVDVQKNAGGSGTYQAGGGATANNATAAKSESDNQTAPKPAAGPEASKELDKELENAGAGEEPF